MPRKYTRMEFLCGKMVLSYRIGNDMTASLVIDTIRDAIQKEKVTDGLALHSDQGSLDVKVVVSNSSNFICASTDYAPDSTVCSKRAA